MPLYQIRARLTTMNQYHVIEADNIEEATKLAADFAEVSNLRIVRVSPFVFNIKEYLKQATAEDQVRHMDTPDVFGINFELHQLRLERQKEGSKPDNKKIPGEPS